MSSNLLPTAGSDFSVCVFMIGECKNGMKREAINVSKAHYVMLHIDLMKIANTFYMKRHFLSVWARSCQLISMLLLAATKSSVQMLFCVRTSVDVFFVVAFVLAAIRMLHLTSGKGKGIKDRESLT